MHTTSAKATCFQRNPLRSLSGPYFCSPHASPTSANLMFQKGMARRLNTPLASRAPSMDSLYDARPALSSVPIFHRYPDYRRGYPAAKQVTSHPLSEVCVTRTYGKVDPIAMLEPPPCPTP